MNHVDQKPLERLRKIQTLLDPSGVPNFLFALLALKQLSDELETTRTINPPLLLPNTAQWKHIIHSQLSKHDAIASAFSAIEQSNPSWRGVFTNIDLENPTLGDQPQREERFTTVLKEIDALTSEYQTLELQESCKFLLDDWSNNTSTGESTTPPAIAQLLTELVDPQPGEKICDPACGIGTLLLLCAHRAQKHATATAAKVTLEGQEIHRPTWALCRMNMLIHGYGSSRVERGDVLRYPGLVDGTTLRQYDIVITDPPFNLTDWGADKAESDPFSRFKIVPPKDQGDLAFVQHCLATLNDNGRAALLLPRGALSRSGTETTIRQHLVEHDLVDTIIELPAKLRHEHALPLNVLLLRKHKSKNRRNRILFIDASHSFGVSGRRNILRPEDIQRIVFTFKNNQSTPGFSCLVDSTAVKASNWNLGTTHYVSTEEKVERIDVQDQLARIADAEAERDRAAMQIDELVQRIQDHLQDRTRSIPFLKKD